MLACFSSTIISAIESSFTTKIRKNPVPGVSSRSFCHRLLDLFDAGVAPVGLQHQPECGVIGKIAHHPVEEYEDPVPDIQQKHQVYEHPREPCENALERKSRQVDHRLAFSHRGHGPLVV